MPPIKDYEYFIAKLEEKVKNDNEFLYELVLTVIKNPNRYSGIFRLTNPKTKLIQNVTQSREIKFGDFIEDITTEYLQEIGYKILDKRIGTDTEGNVLSADQVFQDTFGIYLIEQKIRDDHDSTKKRGQFENFRKKIKVLRKKYPSEHIIACMWFVDAALTKNKKYYQEEATKFSNDNVTVRILYGRELFDDIIKRHDVWVEICDYLERNKKDRANSILDIPDFDTSPEILTVLRELKSKEPSLLKKLLSDSPDYIQLRAELFPTMYNLNKLEQEL